VKNKEIGRRQGKTEGPTAHTREVKLGFVFTPTSWDKEGYCNPRSRFHHVTGAIESAEVWPRSMRKLGTCWRRALQMSVGTALMYLDRCRRHFQGVTPIADLYHAPSIFGRRSYGCSPMRRKSKGLE